MKQKNIIITEEGDYFLQKGKLKIPLIKSNKILDPNIKNALFTAMEFIDFNEILNVKNLENNWDIQELKIFLKNLEFNQKILLKIVAEENKITRSDLMEKMNDFFNDLSKQSEEMINNTERAFELTIAYDNSLFAGTSAAITRKTKTKKKERLYRIIKNSYEVNEKYKEIIIKCYKDVKEGGKP